MINITKSIEEMLQQYPINEWNSGSDFFIAKGHDSCVFHDPIDSTRVIKIYNHPESGKSGMNLKDIRDYHIFQNRYANKGKFESPIDSNEIRRLVISILDIGSKIITIPGTDMIMSRVKKVTSGIILSRDILLEAVRLLSDNSIPVFDVIQTQDINSAGHWLASTNIVAFKTSNDGLELVVTDLGGNLGKSLVYERFVLKK